MKDKTTKLSTVRSGLYDPQEKQCNLTSPKDRRREIQRIRQEMDEYKEFKQQ